MGPSLSNLYKYLPHLTQAVTHVHMGLRLRYTADRFDQWEDVLGSFRELLTNGVAGMIISTNGLLDGHLSLAREKYQTRLAQTGKDL